MPILSKAEEIASQLYPPMGLFLKTSVQMPTTPRNLFLSFCLRKDRIQIPTLPLANKEGSMHVGWTSQEFVGYRNRPQKNKQSRRSLGSWRIRRALPGLTSLLMWIRLQILGEKSSCCAPAAVSGKPPWLLLGAGGHPSEQTIFPLHVPSLSVIIIRSGVQDSPLFVWKARPSRGYVRKWGGSGWRSGFCL